MKETGKEDLMGKYERYVVKLWERRGEVREAPYRREIVPVFGPEREGIDELNANVTYIDPWSGTNYHNHVIAELIWVVAGRGEVLLEDERYSLEPDMVFFIPKGVFHHIRNTSPETLKLYNVFAPGLDRETQKRSIVVKDPPNR
jgi:mannose-6-phosphate isomerase-like protein (cupin superfamily)